MTSSVKPEVNNVSQRRQRLTESRPQATWHCIKIWWRLVVWFSSYVSGQTDRQTDKQTYSSQYFALLPVAN